MFSSWIRMMFFRAPSLISSCSFIIYFIIFVQYFFNSWIFFFILNSISISNGVNLVLLKVELLITLCNTSYIFVPLWIVIFGKFWQDLNPNAMHSLNLSVSSRKSGRYLHMFKTFRCKCRPLSNTIFEGLPIIIYCNINFSITSLADLVFKR